MKIQTTELRLLALSSALLLAACGGDSSDNNDGNNSGGNTPPGPGVSALQVNAADYESWAYVDLENAQVLNLTDAQAQASADWHIALRRTAIKVNGGASGPGNASAALLNTPDGFYNGDEADLNMFISVGPGSVSYEDNLIASYNLADISFSQDSNNTAINGSDWYVYNPQNHTLSANTANAWLLRHADGKAYSRFNITAFSAGAGVSVPELTLSYETQAAETTQFTSGVKTLSAQLTAGQGSVCLDFDTNAVIDCTTGASDWELQLQIAGQAVNLWTNGGVEGSGNGAVLGPQPVETVNAYTSATIINGTDLTDHYSADSSGGVFMATPWYYYNPATHVVHPNYRTYAIDTNNGVEGSAKFTLQVIDYYSLGASGSPELRIADFNEQTAAQ